MEIFITFNLYQGLGDQKMNYPYVLKTGTIKEYFEKIPSLGIPDKVNHKYIYSIGLKSTNDRPVINLLKFLGFIDSAGTPTHLYKEYRNKSLSGKILGGAVQKAYAEVFKIYNEAYKRDTQTLQNFFSTHTPLGERAVKSIVDTFKALCLLSNFGENVQSEHLPQEELQQKEFQTGASIGSSHKIDFILSGNRKVQFVMPSDITSSEVERLKSLLEALKKDEA